MITINYKIKSATIDEINSYLDICKNNFFPPLNEKVEIAEYSDRIFRKSITFEAWDNGTLIGLIAAYMNDPENKLCYITNVSTLKDYGGKGIATELLRACINYAKEHNFKEVVLDVSVFNKQAIHLYKKFGFDEIDKKDEQVTMKVRI